MEIFHVVGSKYNIKALAMMNRKPNVLITGWDYHTQNRRREYRDNIELIREYSDKILIDSGFLSAAKAGKMEWANRLDLVLEAAEDLQADRVAMLDIPMEPQILLSAGFVREDGRPDFSRALELTYRNAQEMVSASTKAAKGFVNQGWTLEHRAECHRTMLAMGADKVAAWWGIGSVCMRTPDTGLYNHAQWCRDNMEGHIHLFGIAKGEWLRQMSVMGINSCDSATAATAARFGEIVANGNRVTLRREADRLGRNQQMASLLYWYNMEAIEYELSRAEAMPAPRQPGPQQARLDL